MLTRPQSRCFKKIGGMQSLKSAWELAFDSIHNLLPVEKDRKKRVLHTLSEKNKEDHIFITRNLLLSRELSCFSRLSLQVKKNVFFYDNVQFKSSGWIRMNLHSLSQRQNFIEVMLCVWWDHYGIIHFQLVNRNQTLNIDLYSQQPQHVHGNFLKKCPVLINRRNIVH